MFFGLKDGHRKLLNLALHLERNVTDAEFDFRDYTRCIYGHGRLIGAIKMWSDDGRYLSMAEGTASAYSLPHEIARRLVLGYYPNEQRLRVAAMTPEEFAASEVSRREAVRRCRVAVGEAMMSSEVV